MNLLTTEQSDKLRKLYYEEALFKTYFLCLKECQSSVFRDVQISPTLVWYTAKQSCIELLSSSAPELEVWELKDKLIQFFNDIINPDHLETFLWLVPASQAYNSATIMVLSCMSSMLAYCGDDDLLPIADAIEDVIQKLDENIPWPPSANDLTNKINQLMHETAADESGNLWHDYSQVSLAEEYILNPPPQYQSAEDLYQVLLFDFYDQHVKQLGYPYTAIGLWEKAREITCAVAQSSQPNTTLLEQLTILENDLIARIQLPNGYHRLTDVEDFNAAKPRKIAAFKYDITDIVELMLTASKVKGLILSTLKKQRNRFLDESGKYADKLACPIELHRELRHLHLSGYSYDYTQPVTSSMSTPEQEPIEAVDQNCASDNDSFFKVDANRSIEACKIMFDEIIKSAKKKGGKQEVLRRLTSVTEGFYFNCSQYSHEELASVLNKLQSKFKFTKSDIDALYRDSNKSANKF